MAKKKKIAMKQVTVVAQFAITMEVPANCNDEVIKKAITDFTTFDVECLHRDVNVVELSDIMEITSITEANLD